MLKIEVYLRHYNKVMLKDVLKIQWNVQSNIPQLSKIYLLLLKKNEKYNYILCLCILGVDLRSFILVNVCSTENFRH